MAGIRGKDTRPEMVIRRGLHRRGFRFRLHDRKLPGKPDLVFKRYHAVVFVNGCFWHQHDCYLFRWPSSRTEFWRAKITGNRNKDADTRRRLREQGWRVLTVWECATRGRCRRLPDDILSEIADWLASGAPDMEIGGRDDGARRHD